MNSIFELKILLTDNCNLSCGYCPVVKDRNRLPIVAGCKAIKDFLAIEGRRRQVCFLGGEPLLEFSTLAYLVKEFASTGLKFVLTTNGTLCTPQITSYLKSKNIEIKVSIDGTPATHNKFRHRAGKASFSAVRNGLMRCNEEGYPVKANLVFTLSTVKRLVDNLDYIVGMGVNYIDIQSDVIALWHQNGLKDASRSFDEFVRYYIALFQSRSSRVFVIPFLRALMYRNDYRCQRTCHKVTLFPNGKYYLCDCLIWLPESAREPFCIGIAGKGIDLARRRVIFTELLNKLRHITCFRCQKCALLSFCCCPIGGFFASSYLGVPYKQYFEGSCKLAHIYLKSYLQILSSLRNNSRFLSAYV